LVNDILIILTQIAMHQVALLPAIFSLPSYPCHLFPAIPADFPQKNREVWNELASFSPFS
jgi:hypothetical protein